MARRSPPITAPAVAVETETVSPRDVTREVFEPGLMLRSSMRALINDPLYWAIQSQYRDRQQYGRIAIEVAYGHEVVGAAFDAKLKILTSKKPLFKPCVRNPTTTQQDMADFANYTIRSMDWSKFIDGVVGQGLEFGFSLTEIVTKFGYWKGNDAILLDALYPLPQASLDHGFIPRDEYSQAVITSDVRYRCFEFDDKGRIEAFVQHAYFGEKDRQVRWEGPDMGRILHFVHKGGDGNPWGQSALFHTMSAWSNLYAIEKMEDVFLDTSLPWLFGTYKSTAGETRQKVHDGAKEALSKAYLDAARRFLMWADGDLKSVAPSNPNFTDHIFKRKAELEARIWQTLHLPKSLVAETSATDGDSRNLVQVYFKHIIKAELDEIGSILYDLITRLLKANFSNITEDDIPDCTWSLVTENETRVAQAMLQAILPHVSSESLPDFVHSLFDFVDPNFIAESHADSVEVARPSRDAIIPSVNDPPEKQPGSQRVRMDGMTEGPAGTTNTAT